MSTPLLSPVHFAVSARSLGHYASNGRSLKSADCLAAAICRILEVPVFGCDDGAPESAVSALLFDLQRANATAYAARYNERLPKVSPPKIKGGKILSAVALLKALRCIHYNCDDGAAIGSSLAASLGKLEEINSALTAHIIDSLPEYDSAEWFIDCEVANA